MSWVMFAVALSEKGKVGRPRTPGTQRQIEPAGGVSVDPDCRTIGRRHHDQDVQIGAGNAQAVTCGGGTRMTVVSRPSGA